jgi:peptidoglycan hydrolase-like protein with peptidoglycan-binding domain
VPAEPETSAPGPEPVVTGSGTIGPTTSGPECTFTENDELPLERCDSGPPIRALQSVLQTLNYGIGTVDCRFGDQTLYAVVAFQTDRGLTADGVVDEETWAALEASFLAGWGEDGNGNDVIEPNEITLECI